MSVIEDDSVGEPVEPLSPYWQQVIEDAWARVNMLELQRDRLERFALAHEAVRVVADDCELSDDEWEALYEEASRNLEEARLALIAHGDIDTISAK